MAEPPAPSRDVLPACLGVVGLGLMGASLARSFRAARPDARVVAVETDPWVRQAALTDGVADVALWTPGPELASCDVVVLCAPLAALLSLLGPVSGYMKNGAVLSDVAGVKKIVMDAARKDVRAPVHFVGAHPMFGGSEGGYRAARADRWRGGVVVVCRDPSAPSNAVAQVTSLHRALGAEVVLCTDEEHDQAVAYASHLPYLAASALLLALDDAPPLARRLAGAGMRDTTRLAEFAFEVQGEVARASPYLPEAARRLTERVSELASAESHAALRERLARAQAVRGQLGSEDASSPVAGALGLAAGAAPAEEARMSSLAGPDPADLDRVAQAALSMVEPGMLLGLGTGRAAEAFIRRLGERVRAGLAIRGVTTSNRSEALARELGIELLSLEQAESLDIAFDGADEVTPDLALTKGLGGALLRERVVAHEAKKFVVLVTPEKLVDKLGERTPIPIEVVPFARAAVTRNLQKIGGRAVVRAKDGKDYLTDNGNLIFDTHFAPIADPATMDAAIRRVPGVVDTGIFLDMADVVLVGERGAVRELRRSRS